MESLEHRNISCYNLTKSVTPPYVTPKSFTELQNFLQLAKNNNQHITIKAGGNSYSDIFLTSENLLIDVSKLNSILSFDNENGIVIVQSGVRIGTLLKTIMPKNWGLVGLSGSVMDQIGGMISSNTHGKDTWKNGNFSQNILSFRILFSDGTIENIEREKNSELFNGVVGGLGFLGIVMDITLKLTKIPSFVVKSSTRRIKNIDDMFEHFYSLDKLDTDFSYALLDPFVSEKDFGKGICESSKYIESNDFSSKQFEENLRPKSKIFGIKPETFWSLMRPFWGNFSSNLLNKVKYARSKNKFSSYKIQSFSKIQYAYTEIPKFNLLYSPSGFFEFQSLFPKSKTINAFIELLSLSKKFNCQPWVCMVKRHKPDTPYLSFSEDGLSIAMNFSLNQLDNNEREIYSDRLYEIILNHGGKIYLSKHSVIPKKIFEQMYPDHSKLNNLKLKYDPNNVFFSDATKRLFKNT